MGASATVDTQPAKPASTDILSGGVVLLASTTQTTFLTIPAGRTWYGTVSVVASSLATTASTQNARVITAGAGAAPAANTIVAVATSSRDTAPGSVTNTCYIAAPVANAVTLDLLNSTATTFGGCASATGVLLP